MGGLNIIGILKYNTNLYKHVNTLILSPHSDTEKVRKEISKLGFSIVKEKLVKDKNIIYPGSTVSLGFDELGEHGMIVGDIEKGKVDLKLLNPIVYDDVLYDYLEVGDKIADAFNVGVKFRK